MADIICIGEAMLRNMSDSDFQSVGGAEMNVATAITQFGWDATWLSILPEDDKGIVNHAAYFGVDCLIFRSQGEVGEYTVLVDEGKVEYQDRNLLLQRWMPTRLHCAKFFLGICGFT